MPDLTRAERVAHAVALRVAEIPYRDSPADQPEMMLVTRDELIAFIVAEMPPDPQPQTGALRELRERLPMLRTNGGQRLPAHSVAMVAEEIDRLLAEPAPAEPEPVADAERERRVAEWEKLLVDWKVAGYVDCADQWQSIQDHMRDRDAEVARLRGEVETLRDALAVVKSFHYDRDKGISGSLEGPLVKAHMLAMHDWFLACGGKNYVEARCHVGADEFVFTMRRASGETPAEMTAALRAENERLRAESLRFYHADGSFETLASAEEVVARRKTAAAEVERLTKERDEAIRDMKATNAELDEAQDDLDSLTAELDRARGGWEALERLRDEITRREEANQKNFKAGISPCKDSAVLLGCTLANQDTIERIGDLLAARPAQGKEGT